MNFKLKQKSNTIFLSVMLVMIAYALVFMLIQLSHAICLFDTDDYVLDKNAVSINENIDTLDGVNSSLSSSSKTTFDYNFTVTTSINAYIDPVTGTVTCTDIIELYNENDAPARIRISNLALVMNDSFTTLSGTWKLANYAGEVYFEGAMGESQSYPDYVVIKPQTITYLVVSCNKSGLLEQRYIGKNVCKFVYAYDYFNPEPYANYTQNNSENQLTFYYDQESDTREGENYILRWTSSVMTRDYMKEHYQDITSIVVDKSFYDYKIDVARYLFGVESDIGTLTNLKKIDMTYLDTSNAYLFEGFMCEIPNLEQCIGLENLNTSTCKNFKYCFKNTKLPENLDLSNWNTSKVQNIIGMFWGIKCSIGPNISNWDVSNVDSLEYLFYRAEVEYFGDMSNWDTSNVTSLWSTFCDCHKAKVAPDLGSWVTKKVTTASHMFSGFGNQNGGVLFTLNLKNWAWYNMQDCYYMFYQATYLSAIYCNTYVNKVSSLKTLNVTHDMFTDCINLDERLKVSTTKTDRTYAYPKSETYTEGFFTAC